MIIIASWRRGLDIEVYIDDHHAPWVFDAQQEQSIFMIDCKSFHPSCGCGHPGIPTPRVWTLIGARRVYFIVVILFQVGDKDINPWTIKSGRAKNVWGKHGAMDAHIKNNNYTPTFPWGDLAADSGNLLKTRERGFVFPYIHNTYSFMMAAS